MTHSANTLATPDVYPVPVAPRLCWITTLPVGSLLRHYQTGFWSVTQRMGDSVMLEACDRNGLGRHVFKCVARRSVLSPQWMRVRARPTLNEWLTHRGMVLDETGEVGYAALNRWQVIVLWLAMAGFVVWITI